MYAEALFVPHRVWANMWVFVFASGDAQDVRAIRINARAASSWTSTQARLGGAGRITVVLFETSDSFIERIEVERLAGASTPFENRRYTGPQIRLAKTAAVALMRFVADFLVRESQQSITKTPLDGAVQQWLIALCDQRDRIACVAQIGPKLLLETERVGGTIEEAWAFPILKGTAPKAVRLSPVTGANDRLVGLLTSAYDVQPPLEWVFLLDDSLVHLHGERHDQPLRDVSRILKRIKAYPTSVQERLSVLMTRNQGAEAGSSASSAMRQVSRAIAPPPRPFAEPSLGIYFSIDVVVPAERQIVLAGRYADHNNLVEGADLAVPGTLQDLKIERFPNPSPLAVKSIEEKLGSSPRRSWFVATADIPEATADWGAVSAKLRLHGGLEATIVGAQAPHSLRMRRDKLLKIVRQSDFTSRFIEKVIARPLAVIQAAHVGEAHPAERYVYGSPPKQPRVSIIIPLYKNYSYLRHQLFHFAIDPDFHEAEVIFVLDAPDDEEHVRHIMQGLCSRLRFNCSLVCMSENAGFAAASNAGAQAATGEVLLMLNSDVIPRDPGWLSGAVQELEKDPLTGISGLKLLHADGALQHAGMYFDRGPFEWWINRHFFKGLPDHVPSANAVGEVPAVTGACLFIRRHLYESVGGFSTDYVVGDFEDSDLCLKVRRDGAKIQYDGRFALYHFERSSISGNTEYTETAAARYNGWLQTHRWDRDIERLMEQSNRQQGAVARAHRAKAEASGRVRPGKVGSGRGS